MELHLPAGPSSAKLAEYLPHKVSQSFRGKNVGNIERILSGAFGFIMLNMAMKRGKVAKALMIPAAFAAFKRAATGKCEIYQAAGLSSAKAPGAGEGSMRELKNRMSNESLDQGGEPLYI